jgi:hypothetical protein
VQLADAAAVTAGTAGRIVDAAQLKAVSDAAVAADDWTRTGTELHPKTAGDSVFTSGAVKVGGTTAAPNITLKADGTANITAPGGGEVLRVQGFRGGGPGTHAAIGLYCDTYPGASQIVMGTRRSTGGLADYAKIQCESENAVSVTGSLQFYTANAASLTERLRITGAGDVYIGGTLPAAPMTILASTGHITIKRQFRFFENRTNGGITKNAGIETISTDGGTNTPTTFCDSRYGAGKYVLLAAFNAAGNAISATGSAGPGSTFVVCITDAATNFNA